MPRENACLHFEGVLGVQVMNKTSFLHCTPNSMDLSIFILKMSEIGGEFSLRNVMMT